MDFRELGPFKEGLEYLIRETGARAVLLGTRGTDPDGGVFWSEAEPRRRGGDDSQSVPLSPSLLTSLSSLASSLASLALVIRTGQ